MKKQIYLKENFLKLNMRLSYVWKYETGECRLDIVETLQVLKASDANYLSVIEAVYKRIKD